MAERLRLLVVSAMFPTTDDPVRGIVVAREVQRLRAAGVDVRVIGKDPGWGGYARQARALLRQRRWPHVVHAHYGTSGFVVRLMRGRTPFVLTLHGSDVAHGARPGASKYWLQFLLSVVGADGARAVLLQDESMASTLPARLRTRAEVLGQPVSLPADALPKTREGLLFLADRDRPVKRFALASEVARRVGRTLDSLDRHPPDGVATALRHARVGLLTSEREGLPVAVKEAMAAGLRVVSVRLPSLESLAEQVGEEVLLLTGEAPAELATGVRRLLALPPLDAGGVGRVHDVLRRRGWTSEQHTAALLGTYAALRDRGPE